MRRPPVLLVVTAALVMAAAAAADGKAVEPGFFGVSAPFLYDPIDEGAREAHVAGIARLGAGTVRLALSWDEVEPRVPRRGVHRYEWEGPDSRVALLARHGLRTYPALAYSADWARELGATKQGAPRPARNDDYASFAAAAAARYGPGGSFWVGNPELPYLPVTHWEVWNEPNLEYFWGGREPDPKQYAHLLSAVLEAIRTVQPRPKMVMGGLSGSAEPNRYLRKVFGEVPSLRKRLDHVGFHPYGRDWRRGFERLASFREALDEHGGKGIWIEVTEDGMSTRDDAERKRYLARMAASAPNSGCHISRYIVHTWVTSEANKREPEHWYGIAGQDAELKASGRAFRRAISDAVAPGAAKPKAAKSIC